MSKLYLREDLICQKIHLVSYRRVPGSIPGRGSIAFFFIFHPFFSLFWLCSSSFLLEFPKLANAQPSNFGPLRIFEDFVEYEKLGMLKYVKDRYTVQLAMKTFAVVLAKSCSREHSWCCKDKNKYLVGIYVTAWRWKLGWDRQTRNYSKAFFLLLHESHLKGKEKALCPLLTQLILLQQSVSLFPNPQRGS